MSKRFSLVIALLVLAFYAAFMISTNNRLSILDDEGIIVVLANSPVAHTVNTFLHGRGQHEHPPLSDIFLHGWLLITHHSFAWLRIFANVFYILGLIALAKCGELLGQRSTAWAILIFGVTWPFGYFYARITGWYCFCFLLVSLLLYCYFLLLRRGTRLAWAAFSLVAIALVWSNYYGIAILLILLFDMVVVQTSFAKKQFWPLLINCAIVVLSFLPLLHALLADAGSAKPAAASWISLVARIGFMLFAILASISVAPWFLAWSIPTGLAVLVLFVTLLASQRSRLFASYFLALILGLAIANHLDLKRLLFLTPLLILSIALCFSESGKQQSITAITAVTIIFTFGWLGIATRSHLATPNFYEPWRSVTADSVKNTGSDHAVISDSFLYFFYLDSALALHESPGSTYLGRASYMRRGMNVFSAGFPEGLSGSSFSTVTTIQGVNNKPQMREEMTATIQQLQQTCRMVASERFTPDYSELYKRMLDPGAPSVAYRIVVDHFDCRDNRSRETVTH